VIDGQVVRIREPGDASVLELVPRAIRDPGPDEVRIAVRACGLNRADILQRRGLYPAPLDAPSDVPGLELAGTVESRGERVRDWATGDRVMAIVSGGAMASHVVLHARELVAMPADTSFADAGAIPEAFMTAWDALFGQAELRPGMTVLVHAIASGVGTAALQIASRFGARVIGTSRSAKKMERFEAVRGLEEGIVMTETKEPPARLGSEQASEWGAVASHDGRWIAYASDATRRMEVYVRGADGAMWKRVQEKANSKWRDWVSEGGVIASTVALGANPGHRLEAFVRGGDGALWHKWQEKPNSKWKDWASLGGNFTSNPIVGKTKDGRLEVFVTTQDNVMWHIWQKEAGGAWGHWASGSGPVGGHPAGAEHEGGRGKGGRFGDQRPQKGDQCQGTAGCAGGKGGPAPCAPAAR